MKGNDRPGKIYESLFSPEENKKLSGFKDFITNLDYQEIGKQSLFSDYSTKKSKLVWKAGGTSSTQQTITLDCEKKELLITQIVVSEKTTKIVMSKETNFDNRQSDFEEEDEEEADNLITIAKKISDLTQTLIKYCKYKQFGIPSQITIEHVSQEPNAYGCMYYTISAQFKLLPIYECSTLKLDQLCVENAQKSILNSIILKHFRTFLKEIISKHELLKLLFDLLRHPSFPSSKFHNTKKIIFLQLLSEALFFKKKRTNRKKNKKKNNDAAQKSNSDTEEEEQTKQKQQQPQKQPEQSNVLDKEFQDIREKVQNLSEIIHFIPITLSQEFMSDAFVQLQKLNHK